MVIQVNIAFKLPYCLSCRSLALLKPILMTTFISKGCTICHFEEMTILINYVRKIMYRRQKSVVFLTRQT